MKLVATADNVFACADSPALLTPEVLATLRTAAERSPLRRARVCMHPDPSAPLHEMLVLLLRGSYIRPHRHLGKSESFHLVEGAAGVVFFDENGQVRRRVRMDRAQPGDPFYYRIEAGVFHCQVVLADFVLFHECTAGPFDPSRTVFASWSPADSSPAVVEYHGRLAREFKSSPS